MPRCADLSGNRNLRNEHMSRWGNLSGFVFVPRLQHVSGQCDLSGQPNVLYSDDGGPLADMCGQPDLFRIHADLRNYRPDLYRLADLHRYGDVQQDADLRSGCHVRCSAHVLLDRHMRRFADLCQSADLRFRHVRGQRDLLRCLYL